jgi:hypothetical protein
LQASRKEVQVNVWVEGTDEPVDLPLPATGDRIREIGESAIRHAGFVLTRRSEDVFEGDRPT